MHGHPHPVIRSTTFRGHSLCTLEPRPFPFRFSPPCGNAVSFPPSPSTLPLQNGHVCCTATLQPPWTKAVFAMWTTCAVCPVGATSGRARQWLPCANLFWIANHWPRLLSPHVAPYRGSQSFFSSLGHAAQNAIFSRRPLTDFSIIWADFVSFSLLLLPHLLFISHILGCILRPVQHYHPRKNTSSVGRYTSCHDVLISILSPFSLPCSPSLHLSSSTDISARLKKPCSAGLFRKVLPRHHTLAPQSSSYG